MPAAYQLPYWCSSSSFSQLSTPATPFTSPVIIPVGPTSPPSLRQSSSPLPLAESLPFNSLHLAAEYNLYQLKAQLVSSVPAFEIHARLRARPYPDPATLSAKRHSAASLRRTSEEKDDSKPLSIPRAVQSCAASSESSDSLRIPRWYYEDRLRQVVEQMERKDTQHANKRIARSATAPTPYTSPPIPSYRTVRRASTSSRPITVHQQLLAGSQSELVGANKLKCELAAMPMLDSSTIQFELSGVYKPSLATHCETECEDATSQEEPSCGKDSSMLDDKVCGVRGMSLNLRRMKLLNMAV